MWTAHLVSEWLRVGYCQGNMNSDNAALGGVTLDYGPFAFMERFMPVYNPWVGGGMAYAFARQPQAAAINLSGLSQAFVELAESVGRVEGRSDAEVRTDIERVRAAVSHGFVDSFHAKQDEASRSKLGLKEWDEEAGQLWDELFRLMSTRCGTEGVDFTLLFRGLAVPPPDDATLCDDALVSLVAGGAALQDTREWAAEQRAEWAAWARQYWARVRKEQMEAGERVASMKLANPKYILRNWMAAEAYEAAALGDYSTIRELQRVLSRPYDDQGTRAPSPLPAPTLHLNSPRQQSPIPPILPPQPPCHSLAPHSTHHTPFSIVHKQRQRMAHSRVLA